MGKKYGLFLLSGGILLFIALLLVHPTGASASLPPVLTSENSSTYQAALAGNVFITISGSGIVVSSPAGIYCGSICSHTFPVGIAISLTATPLSSFSEFYLWSGDVYSSENPVYLTGIDNDYSIQANFVQFHLPYSMFLPLLAR